MKQFTEIWLDTIDFQEKGGWQVDTQFAHLMGSGYLIAADIPGEPVADAVTTVEIPATDTYRIWARTRNWLRPHDPGEFALLVNGQDNGVRLGKRPSDDWIWEIAGDFALAQGNTTLTLRDLTGYFGRCASLIITNDFDYTPSREIPRIHKDRARMLGIDISEKFGGEYDVIVAGGGPGGVPAALAAARQGAKTLLIQNRPVLGGNGSREIGITFEGASSHFAYGREGGIAEEIRRLRDRDPAETGSWTTALNQLTENQENLTVIFNSHVCDVVMENDSVIEGVIAQDLVNYGKTRYTAKQFIDCTGDGWLGYFAGAKYRFGREGQHQYGENLAPEIADTQIMSGCIRADRVRFLEKKETPWYYHAPDWVPKLPEDPVEFGRFIKRPGTRMAWWLEASNTYDNMWDGEESRDALFLVILGYLDHLKNHWEEEKLRDFLHFRFPSIFVGRRESRRFVGDYVLTQQDCTEGARFEDGISYTGWHIDIHHPEGIYSGKKGPLYCTVSANMPHVPFRCLYSVNIANLMFAGRNISTTHIAMGTTRVQNTIATFGQAVGTAAAMCVKLGENPRGIYKNHMKALQQQLLKDDQYIPDIKNEDPNDPCLTAEATASSVCTTEVFSLRRGVPGALMPLDQPRLTTLTVSRRNGDVPEFYVKLHSAAETPRTVTVHAMSLGGDVDTSVAVQQTVKTAQIVVPPMGEHWVKVPIYLPVEENKHIESCGFRIWIDPAADISWRMIEKLNMYANYGEQKPDGSWLIREGKCYYVQAAEPKTVMANCGAGNVNNGVNRIVDANRYEWVSDPKQPLPQWVELKLQKQETLTSVSLAFDTDMVNPATSWSYKVPNPAKCVKDYTVEVFGGGKWVTVADVQDNFMRKRNHTFAPIAAEKIRVTAKETWGDPSARIMEIRAEKV